jgi:hypothetical protein
MRAAEGRDGDRAVDHGEGEREAEGELPGRLRLAMKLAAAHQPNCYVGRLQQRALGRKMGSQIPRDGNKCVSAPRRGPTHKLPQNIELFCGFASGAGSRSAPVGAPPTRQFWPIHQWHRAEFRSVLVRC